MPALSLAHELPVSRLSNRLWAALLYRLARVAGIRLTKPARTKCESPLPLISCLTISRRGNSQTGALRGVGGSQERSHLPSAEGPCSQGVPGNGPGHPVPARSAASLRGLLVHSWPSAYLPQQLEKTNWCWQCKQR